MKKWYSSTNSAQRAFMFVAAIVAALCGFGEGTSWNGSPFAFALILPLLLLIYLQLGMTKKTEANGNQTNTPTMGNEMSEDSKNLQTRFNLAHTLAQQAPSNGVRYRTPKGALRGLPDPDQIDWSKVDAKRKEATEKASKE